MLHSNNFLFYVVIFINFSCVNFNSFSWVNFNSFSINFKFYILFESHDFSSKC